MRSLCSNRSFLMSCVTMAMIEPLCSSFPTPRKWEQQPYRQVCRLTDKASHWARSMFFFFVLTGLLITKPQRSTCLCMGPPGLGFQECERQHSAFYI